MINKQNKKIFLLLGLIFVFFSSANFILALEMRYPSFGELSITDNSTLADYITYFWAIGTNLAIFAALISIAFGGISYLVSYARGKFTDEGKAWAKAGLLGLLIIVSASLMIKTINPNLVKNFGVLDPVISNILNGSQNKPPKNSITYQELPMGTLTETLLTSTYDCYGFDQWGDPVDGDTVEGEDGARPTYTSHDRADCLTQLIEGAQKKSMVIAELSYQIKKLMDECDCNKTGCDSWCKPYKECVLNNTPGKVFSWGDCIPGFGWAPHVTGVNCLPIGAPHTNYGSCCDSGNKCNNQYQKTDKDCCRPGDKKKIEEGPIEVSINAGGVGAGECKAEPVTYDGLNEFRCLEPGQGGVSAKSGNSWLAGLFDGIGSLFQNLNFFQNFQNLLTPLQALQNVQSSLQGLQNPLQSLQVSIQNPLQSLQGLGSISNLQNTLQGSLQNLQSSIQNPLQSLQSITSIQNPLQSLQSSIQNPLQSLQSITSIQNPLQTLQGSMQSSLQSLQSLNTLPDLQVSLQGSLQNLQGSLQNLQNLGSLQVSLQGLQAPLQNLQNLGSLQGQLQNIQGSLQGLQGTNVLPNLQTSLQNLQNPLQSLQGSINAENVESLQGLSQTLQGSLQNLQNLGSLRTSLQTLQGLQGSLQNSLQNIQGLGSLQGLPTSLQNSLQGLQGSLQTQLQGLQNPLQSLQNLGSLQNTLQGSLNNLQGSLQGSLQGLQNSIQTLPNSLQGSLQNLQNLGSMQIQLQNLQGLQNSLQGSLQNLQGLGTLQGLPNSLQTQLQGLQNSLQGSLQGLQAPLQNLQNLGSLQNSLQGSLQNLQAPLQSLQNLGSLQNSLQSLQSPLQNSLQGLRNIAPLQNSLQSVQDSLQGLQAPLQNFQSSLQDSANTLQAFGGSGPYCFGPDAVAYVEEQMTINSGEVDERIVTVINQDKWKGLTLLQQLIYLQQKIKDWPKDTKIQDDLSALTSAEATLNKCYLVVPYVGLLNYEKELTKNQYEDSTKEKYILLTKKFTDQKTKEEVDSSKYCKDFNYNNSSCLKKCNDACPDTSDETVDCYKACGENDASCIKNCYDTRTCEQTEGNYSNFDECMTDCQTTCQDLCKEKYLECSDGYKFCVGQCKNNGQCVRNNSESCLFNSTSSNAFINCANNSPDPASDDAGNTEYCIQNSYMCNNGSDLYASYPDCLQQKNVRVTPRADKTCKDFNGSKDSCESAGCFWSENANCSGACSWNDQNQLSPSNNACSSFDDENSCSANSSSGCSWDFIYVSGSNSSQICNAAKTSGTECVWDPVKLAYRIGQEKKCYLRCSNIKNPEQCDVQNTCIWNNNTCSDFSCPNLKEQICRIKSPQCVWKDNVTCKGECTGTPTKIPPIQQVPPAGFKNCWLITDQKYCESSKECTWDFIKKECLQNYSASYLFENKPSQVCSNPYEDSCLEKYPETSKCPTNSFCPDCPCDTTSQKTLSFPALGGTIGNYITSTENILAHQMVAPECNKYSYNDDPLTFYCMDSYTDANGKTFSGWWNDPTKPAAEEPMGGHTIINLENETEIPVGQTVDDAEKWANDLITTSGIMAQYVQSIINQMKILGKAEDAPTMVALSSPSDVTPLGPVQNYCGCMARTDSDVTICKTNCLYWYAPPTPWSPSFCGTVFKQCSGSPCQQMTNYLQNLWSRIGYFVSNDYYIDFANFYAKMIKEPRSDIIKELAYSRKTMSDCSLINSAYDQSIVPFSCTVVQDELVPPIFSNQLNFKGNILDGYCYGQAIDQTLQKTPVDKRVYLTDNWFCVEEREK